jgi:hypothetical protein
MCRRSGSERFADEFPELQQSINANQLALIRSLLLKSAALPCESGRIL